MASGPVGFGSDSGPAPGALPPNYFALAGRDRRPLFSVPREFVEGEAWEAPEDLDPGELEFMTSSPMSGPMSGDEALLPPQTFFGSPSGPAPVRGTLLERPWDDSDMTALTRPLQPPLSHSFPDPPSATSMPVHYCPEPQTLPLGNVRSQVISQGPQRSNVQGNAPRMSLHRAPEPRLPVRQVSTWALPTLGKSQPAGTPVSMIPDQFRPLFQFTHFNAMQSACVEAALHTDNNMVISGSGKTVLMELAIVRLLREPTRSQAKVVYMAPTRALCSERCQDWWKKFQHMGVAVGELTGDTESSGVSEIAKSAIIVTTPEKWDSMTRRWMDNAPLLSRVQLLLIDEVHILQEPKRGATLEVVVSRMKTLGSARKVRLVALSATVPNIHDLGKWLDRSPAEPAVIKVFGEEFRPVKLQKHVIGYPGNKENPFVFDKNLNAKIMPLLEQYSQGKPSLVFCATRKSAVSLAEELARNSVPAGSPAHPFVKTSTQASQLAALTGQLQDRKLGDLARSGVSFHHAGIVYSDRRLLEKAFSDGLVPVLCTTSTLAVGVNLPAHLVIVKSTMSYAGGKYQEYSPLDLLQMVGRAGRPQFDHEGVALILTHTSTQALYDNLVTGSRSIESSLHESFIEHLNAEVVLGTIQSIPMALAWLRSSFLYIRIQQNPAHYRLSTNSSLSAELQLQGLCVRNLERLVQTNLIFQQEGAKSLFATPLGQVMAKFYIKFDTMARLAQVKPLASLKDVLTLTCQAAEFDENRFMAGEKGVLNALKGIRFPLAGKRVKDIADKVYLLIQCALGHVTISSGRLGPLMQQELVGILSTAKRVIRCLVQVCQHLAFPQALLSSLTLEQCLAAKVWDNGLVLRQIPGIGTVMVNTLKAAQVATFQDLDQLDGRQIECVLHRNPPFGNQVLDDFAKLPRFTMALTPYQEKWNGSLVEFYIQIGFSNPNSVLLCNKTGPCFAVFLAMTNANVLVDMRKLAFARIKDRVTLKVVYKMTLTDDKICCHLMSDSHVGLDLYQEYTPELSNRATTPRALAIAPLNMRPGQSRTDSNDNWGPELDVDEETLNALLSTEQGEQQSHSSVGPGAGWQNASSFPKPFVNDSHSAPALGNQFGGFHDMAPQRNSDRDTQQRAEGKRKASLPNHVECKHTCKDKSRCSHKCCKEGIQGKRRRTAMKTPEPPTARLHSGVPSPREFVYSSPEAPARSPLQSFQPQPKPRISVAGSSPSGFRSPVLKGPQRLSLPTSFRSPLISSDEPEPSGSLSLPKRLSLAPRLNGPGKGNSKGKENLGPRSSSLLEVLADDSWMDADVTEWKSVTPVASTSVLTPPPTNQRVRPVPTAARVAPAPLVPLSTAESADFFSGSAAESSIARGLAAVGLSGPATAPATTTPAPLAPSSSSTAKLDVDIKARIRGLLKRFQVVP